MHDVAKATAHAIVEIFNLSDSEYREAVALIYERVEAGLWAYTLTAFRWPRCPEPSPN